MSKLKRLLEAVVFLAILPWFWLRLEYEIAREKKMDELADKVAERMGDERAQAAIDTTMVMNIPLIIIVVGAYTVYHGAIYLGAAEIVAGLVLAIVFHRRIVATPK